MAVSELLKRLCRYLLHRYLGPFLEEKVALDQLHLSLDKGTGTVTQLSLDAAHLNEILAKYHLPFSVIDGYIGSVTIFLPVALSNASFSSMLSVTAESFASFGGLRLELSDVQFTIRGLDNSETTVMMGNSLDLLATSICSSDFGSASQSLAIDYSQSVFSTGFNLPLEGLDQLASVIDSIVNQVEIVVKELVVRLEPFDTTPAEGDNLSIAAIELHLHKACASLSIKESSREVSVLLTNIEVRAETYADKEAETTNSTPGSESSYAILLRIPDANISLSVSTVSSPTFFTKIIASSLIAFFPGPDVLCSVISMLDTIFNKKRAPKPSAALFESFTNNIPDPVMFESCAGSVMLSDQMSLAGGERSTSPSVHFILHIVRTAVVVAYNTPQGSLTPQSMSVAFFASLPSDAGVSCSLSRNSYAMCCPADCFIVQFLSSKVDVVFNAQQPAFTLLEREGSSLSTLRNAIEWDTTVQPLRVSVRLSVDCFDIVDCIRLAQTPCQFNQLLICDDAEDARPALTIDILIRFTGFREVRISVNKPCQSELDLSIILDRPWPLFSAISSNMPIRKRHGHIQHALLHNSPHTSPQSPGTFNVRFEKLRMFVRFPKHQPLSFGYEDTTLHPETLVLDTEKFSILVTQTYPNSPFSEVVRDVAIDCQTLNCFFQVHPSQLPVSVFRASSFRANFSPKKNANTADASHRELHLLFADPPMRLHNGRELHVPTQAPLKFDDSDSITFDIQKFNVALPPVNVLHLLAIRVTELNDIVDSFIERRRYESQQTMERSVMLETTGNSIYYSMTTATVQQDVPMYGGPVSSSSTIVPRKRKRSFGIRFDTLLISASLSKDQQQSKTAATSPANAKPARRVDLFGANAIALYAFDLCVHITPTAGWVKVGSLSLLDAHADPTNSVTPGGLEFFAPVLRSSMPTSPSTSQSSSNIASDQSSSLSTTTKNQPTLVVVWRKSSEDARARIAARLSNISLDLCSPPGKIPSCIQIACEIAEAFEKEFQWSSQPPPTKQTSLHHNASLSQSQRWDLCVEATNISIYLRTKVDQDLDGFGNQKPSSLPGLCLSVDSVLFDASPTSKVVLAPGQPPVGDLWLGLGNSVLQLFQDVNEDPHDGSVGAGRRERIFQADWLEFTFGLSSTAFVDVCGSSISISTTVNNLSALFALCATIAGGLRNAQVGPAAATSGPTGHDDSTTQVPLYDTPFELRDALQESSYLTGTSPENADYSAAKRANWSSPVSTGSGRDSSDDDFLILSSSFVKKLPSKAECHKLAPSNVPLKIVDNHLPKPLLRPDPLSIQPHGWPTPVFRFTVRDTTVRCVLSTERGDSLEIGLVRLSVRYERCPNWTPNLYRISASIQDVEVLERHPDSSQPSVICSRLVTDDVPRIHSAPQILLKVAVVRPSNCAVPLLKQNSALISQDAECDVRMCIQPIRIRASMRTKELFQNLATKLNGLSNLAAHQTASASSDSVSALLNTASSPTPIGIKSPTHQRLISEVGRGAPVLFDETQQRISPTQSGQSGRSSSSSATVVPSAGGLFIRSFALQPPVLLEINFSGSISTTANVPIHLDRCRLVLPSLSEARKGFADVPSLVDYVSEQWKNAILSQKSAFVTAGTGLNKLTSSAQELASAVTDLGALILAPAMIYSEDLPSAMTVDSQLRPGRVLRGITTSAASLSADVVMKLFSTAVPLLQHASTAASNLLNANAAVQRPSTPEPKNSTVSSSSSSSSLHHRERNNSRSQADDALRRAASSALLAGKPIETAGVIIAHSHDG